MTSHDYHIVMKGRLKGVRIADLKSRLSEYLRAVRQGHILTVLDRETPIAKIIPYQMDSAHVTVRHPLPGSPKLKNVTLPPPLRLKTDAVQLLLRERQTDR